MKHWQKRMTSPSDLPLGSKSLPPLPPPMGMPVSAFLKICSKPRNLMMPRLTEGWKRRPPLYGPSALLNSTRKPRLIWTSPWSSCPRHAEDDLPLGLADPLDDLACRRTPGAWPAPARGSRAPRARPGGTRSRRDCGAALRRRSVRASRRVGWSWFRILLLAPRRAFLVQNEGRMLPVLVHATPVQDTIQIKVAARRDHATGAPD